MKLDRARLVPESRALFAETERALRGGAIVHGLAVMLAAVAVVLLLSSQAHAQAALGGPIGDPCAPGYYDPDAGVELAVPTDGGAPDPVVLCQGQRAPASGSFLRVDTAALYAGQLAGSKQEVNDLKAQLAQPPPLPSNAKTYAIVAAGAFVLGVVATALVVHELK